MPKEPGFTQEPTNFLDVQEDTPTTEVQKEEPVQESQEPNKEPTPQKIVVDGVEYTPEEAKELISLGKIGKEAETKYNTKIDRIWPDYTSKSQKLKELEENSKPKEEPNLDDEEELKKARDMARKIGILTKEDVEEMGFVTKSNFRQNFDDQMGARELLSSMKDLEKEVDGTDGRPKFDTGKVLEFMANHNIEDPQLAYKTMHIKELEEWGGKKIESAKPKAYKTLEGGNMPKEPAPKKVTPDNLTDSIREALGNN